MLLIPWANAKYDLSHLQLKGHALFHFSKKLREDLDTKVGLQLNLRRSIRQEVAVLFTNLPIFIQHHQNNSWPAWLRKKSYFKDSSLFYRSYMEAMAEEPTPDRSLNLFKELPRKEHPGHVGQRVDLRKIKPAFSPKRGGGIFGFKK